jgi:hypothetical protein
MSARLFTFSVSARVRRMSVSTRWIENPGCVCRNSRKRWRGMTTKRDGVSVMIDADRGPPSRTISPK